MSHDEALLAQENNKSKNEDKIISNVNNEMTKVT